MKLVKLYADWCVPCKRVSPAVEAACNELEVSLVSLNVDEAENKALASENGIKMVPALLLYDDNDVLIKTRVGDVGGLSKEDIKAWVLKSKLESHFHLKEGE